MVEDYVRNARLIRVLDGDTLDVDIDLGFRIWMRQRVRVLGIDCPERHGSTLHAGIAASSETEDWCCQGPFVVKTHLDKSDSFGRVLAELWRDDDSLAMHLLKHGHAVEYRQ